VSLRATIEDKLRAAFEPALLEVVNESHMHKVPKGAETHFKVVLVSGAFEGKSSVARHQMVYRALSEEMRPGKIHALAITSRTPAEWDADPIANESPLCASNTAKKSP
jgi:BolA protein